MGVGLTVAADIDATVAQRDREKELLSIGRQFQTAIGRYYETQLPGGRREYPGNLEDLLQDPRFPGVKRHLRKIFTDPMTGKPEWGLVRVSGRIVGVYSLSEKRPIKQANFEAEVAHFQGASKYTEWKFAYPSDLVMSSLPAEGQGLPSDQSSPSVEPLQEK